MSRKEKRPRRGKSDERLRLPLLKSRPDERCAEKTGRSCIIAVMRSNAPRWIAGLAVAVLFAGACSGLFPTRIGDIHASPRKFAGRQVTVKGTVTETVNLLFVKYFVIRDDTGEIPVVTERVLPARGETVTINGKVQEAFALGDERLLVIVEPSQ